MSSMVLIVGGRLNIDGAFGGMILPRNETLHERSSLMRRETCTTGATCMPSARLILHNSKESWHPRCMLQRSGRVFSLASVSTPV